MRHVRHSLSAIFGDMSEQALMALAEDIKQKGILDPVVLYDGQVLDGWHRCKAGQIAGVEIPYVQYEGDDPGGFVISKNLHRRQKPLTASQRAALVIEIHEWRPVGRPGNSAPVRNYSAQELAAEAEVSERTIEQAKAAHRAGLGEAVAKGEMSAKAAAETVKPPAEPKKTPLDKANEEIEEFKAHIADLKETIQDLIDNQESAADAALPDAEQAVKFEQLREYIRTLESQVREWMDKFNLVLRENKSLRKRLGLKA